MGGYGSGWEPGPILLMGAPGVGKGTQAKELMARWGVPQVSTGDLLRANVANGTRLGLRAKALMDAGLLVPDEVVNRMVEARLAEPDTSRGYLLDGYPRTVAQAKTLDAFLSLGSASMSALNDTVPNPGTRLLQGIVAVSLVVPYTRLLRRITGRRLCPVCGSIYNIYLHPPTREGFCDLDSTLLERRDDDSEAVFQGRMRAYETLTAPVLGHYRALGRLVEVDGEGAPEQVTGRVEAEIRRQRTS